MCLVICFRCIVLVSVSPIIISASKVHLFKTKIIKTAEKEPYKLVGVMAGSVLHYILGWEACEFYYCTMRLYWRHHLSKAYGFLYHIHLYFSL